MGKPKLRIAFQGCHLYSIDPVTRTCSYATEKQVYATSYCADEKHDSVLYSWKVLASLWGEKEIKEIQCL